MEGPDGFAVHSSSGYWVGIWRDINIAKDLQRRSKAPATVMTVEVVSESERNAWAIRYTDDTYWVGVCETRDKAQYIAESCHAKVKVVPIRVTPTQSRETEA